MYYWQGKKYTKRNLKDLFNIRLNESLTNWERVILAFAQEWLDESKQIFEVQTSGSTGKPKKIRLTRKQMQESAQATRDFLGLKPGNSVLLVLPAEFIAGKMMIVRALELGLDLYYYPPQVSVIEEVDRTFDFAALIPLQIQYAIDSGHTKKLDLIRQTIIGGASLSEKYVQQLQDRQSTFFATYGMTETITHVAMKDLKEKNSKYEALPGIKFSVDENQCLKIHSNRLANAITHTNDIVGLESDTKFTIKGRLDNVINSGGLKIFPEELEGVIQKAIAQEAFIGYRDDEKLGQAVVLVLEEAELNEKEVLNQISVLIPSNKLPKKILSIPSFFRTKNHKTDRRKMQNWITENSF